MSYYEEDFYYEPSEFDILVNEFKASLTKSVKEEFISKMELLEKENEELQVVKANFEEIKNDYAKKERQLENERNDLVRKVRRERLANLMKDFEVIMYRAYAGYEKPSKCDKCGERRRIKYKSPLGKDVYEDCDCNKGNTVYSPKEYICSEFKIDRNGNAMSAWYKLKPERDYDYALYDSSTYANTIYKSDMKNEDIEKYDTFFKSKDECQGYCDYLNANPQN